MDPRLKIVAKIAHALNEKEIRWAIGGSLLLFLKGITFNFNDLDLMVLEEDAVIAREVLMAIGEYHPNSGGSSSKVFDDFTVDGLDVDLISGFVITAYGNVNDCSFKNENVEHMEIEGEDIRLDSLETWYEIYSLQGRVEKARYIKDYLLYHKK